MKNKFNYSLSIYVNFFIALIFIISAVVIVGVISREMRSFALSDAEDKAKMILHHNLATHTYFSHELKPSVFDLTDPCRPKEYFEPKWMSSTYAVREITNNFKRLSEENKNYYYKECAINARSPENEADDYEKEFIKSINNDAVLNKKTDIRLINDHRYFVVLLRGEVMEKSCLRCHDTPKRAPAELVRQYGGVRSFDRSEGETVSAISIRIPLKSAFEKGRQITVKLSGGLLFILICLFISQFFIQKKIITTPLQRIEKKANEIAEDETLLGKELEPGTGKELNGLTSAFNRMSTQLRVHIDSLEDLVSLRTSKLTKLNVNLNQEIENRRESEAEKEVLIMELKEALHEIKTLRGILPLCSFCKKIRNDKDEWEQVDSYIHKNSEADISHSICPDCLEKHYPED